MEHKWPSRDHERIRKKGVRDGSRSGGGRTYRSKRISMNRALRLLWVHMRSTVLSAWFSEPESCVT